MAIITPDSTCAICERPFNFEQEPIFATWGVFAVPPELFRFCDAPLHWDCYAAWPHRAVFAAAYFQMWVEIAREDAFWSQVWLDEKLLVTVNPDEPVAEVSLRLAETGSVFRVKLADWTTWLAVQCHSPQGNHPIETAALTAILSTLQTHLPTSDAILNRIDFVARQARWEARERKIADRRAREQAELLEHNGRCAALWKQKPVCPFCEGREIRYTNGKNVRKSFFQCVTCGRTFRPEDYPPA